MNADYFDFDTDIIIQLADTGKRIVEVAVPTFYGGDISRIGSFRYGCLSLHATIQSRIMKWGLFYHPKFDYNTDNAHYSLKLGFDSSHQFALDRLCETGMVLDIGCGPGHMARELSGRGKRAISIDRFIQPMAMQHSHQAIAADVETYDFASAPVGVGTILLLDILEHLRHPEETLRRIRARYAGDGPVCIVTTGNVGFITVRVGLLLGLFNYGKVGILDLDHTRLFTFASLRSVLEQNGFDVLEEHGISAPFPKALGDTRFARFLLSVNQILIKLSKSLFSYQIAVLARPCTTLGLLLETAYHTSSVRSTAIKTTAVSNRTK